MVTLRCTFSMLRMSFFRYGDQTSEQYSRCGQALIQDQISTSPSPRAVDASRGLRLSATFLSFLIPNHKCVTYTNIRTIKRRKLPNYLSHMTQDGYQIHLFYASPTSPSVHFTSPKDWWTGLWISLWMWSHQCLVQWYNSLYALVCHRSVDVSCHLVRFLHCHSTVIAD